MDKISQIVPASARTASLERARTAPDLGPTPQFTDVPGQAAGDSPEDTFFIVSVEGAPPPTAFTPRGSFVDVRA